MPQYWSAICDVSWWGKQPEFNLEWLLILDRWLSLWSGRVGGGGGGGVGVPGFTKGEGPSLPSVVLGVKFSQRVYGGLEVWTPCPSGSICIQRPADGGSPSWLVTGGDGWMGWLIWEMWFLWAVENLTASLYICLMQCKLIFNITITAYISLVHVYLTSSMYVIEVCGQ